MPPVRTKTYSLLCLLLGEHPRQIFKVKIASTKTVSDLKELIKEKKTAFRDLDADTLQLWKVDLPVDNTLERNVNNIKLDQQQLLSAVDGMFEVFDSPPQPKHLHILVQPLPAAGHSLINLNCLVLGNHCENIFMVKIALMDTVNNLQELIKEKKTAFCDLDHDADALQLWKVDLPVDDSFERTVNELELVPQKVLSTVDGMFEFFDSPQYKHLHIVVKPQLPCPHIDFSAAVWSTHPNMQVISTALPLFYHPTNSKMCAMVARHVGALKKALQSLLACYQGMMSPSPNQHLRFLDSKFQDPMFPYPYFFTCIETSLTCDFTYYNQMDQSRLLFSAVKTTDNKMLCIKFVHRYSKEVHQRCASDGFAPALLGFEQLPGGWYMVVMEMITDDYCRLQEIAVPYPYHDVLATELQSLHRGGYVHGDIWDTNIMLPLLRKPNPKLVPALKQVVQTPESPPTSTLELDNDDNGGNDDEEGKVGADSSFDCVFNADVDALVATTRQYD
ncbi:hypothetical protein C8R48DRAFT_837810 [Suillus tomentosus]|nr:hypothetical protein C8R48DRAFT_837810 [Suillus tomentosus]